MPRFCARCHTILWSTPYRPSTNDYEDAGEVTFLFIDSPTYGRMVCTLDSRDYASVRNYRWTIASDYRYHTFYVRAKMSDGQSLKTVAMHRFLTGHISKTVDHYNGDGLDNRRVNLRPCDYSLNAQNRSGPTRLSKSGYRGVHYQKSNRNKPWCAKVCVNGTRYREFFSTFNEAVTRVAAMRKEHLPFSVT